MMVRRMDANQQVIFHLPDGTIIVAVTITEVEGLPLRERAPKAVVGFNASAHIKILTPDKYVENFGKARFVKEMAAIKASTEPQKIDEFHKRRKAALRQQINPMASGNRSVERPGRR